MRERTKTERIDGAEQAGKKRPGRLKREVDEKTDACPVDLKPGGAKGKKDLDEKTGTGTVDLKPGSAKGKKDLDEKTGTGTVDLKPGGAKGKKDLDEKTDACAVDLKPISRKKDLSEKVDFRQVERLAGLGLTDRETGRALGVSESTVNRWKKDERFLEALKRGKEAADRAVVKSLYKKALGYTYTETTTEVGPTGKALVTKKVRKRAHPDTAACVFWLKNRRPAGWRDRVEHTGEGGGVFKVEFISFREGEGGPEGEDGEGPL